MEKQGRDSALSRDPYDGMLALIHTYFPSIYVGDAAALRSTFHPKCRVFAEVKGTQYEKSGDDCVDSVANRRSPRDLGESFLMKVLGIETLGSVTLVRTHQQMLGFNYSTT